MYLGFRVDVPTPQTARAPPSLGVRRRPSGRRRAPRVAPRTGPPGDQRAGAAPAGAAEVGDRPLLRARPRRAPANRLHRKGTNGVCINGVTAEEPGTERDSDAFQSKSSPKRDAKHRCPARFASCVWIGKGRMRSALIGSLQITCFFDRDFLGAPVNLLLSSQNCQGVPFSPS